MANMVFLRLAATDNSSTNARSFQKPRLRVDHYFKGDYDPLLILNVHNTVQTKGDMVDLTPSRSSSEKQKSTRTVSGQVVLPQLCMQG